MSSGSADCFGSSPSPLPLGVLVAGSLCPRQAWTMCAMTFQRSDHRAADALRPITLTRHYTKHAEGSVLIAFGHTKVLCTASVEEKVPPHKRGSGCGWVTAEYGMLPRATHTRSDREAARGKQSGRTQEIQRLIGRSLRCVFDLKALGERTISLDCDVIQADGGNRGASTSMLLVACFPPRPLCRHKPTDLTQIRNFDPRKCIYYAILLYF